MRGLTQPASHHALTDPSLAPNAARRRRRRRLRVPANTHRVVEFGDAGHNLVVALAPVHLGAAGSHVFPQVEAHHDRPQPNPSNLLRDTAVRMSKLCTGGASSQAGILPPLLLQLLLQAV